MRKFHLGLWNETFQHLGGKDGGGGIAYLLSTVNIQLIAGRIAPETVWIHRKQESFQGEHCVLFRTPPVGAQWTESLAAAPLLHHVRAEATPSLRQ